MRYYSYLNRRYGLGLEASYIDSTMTSMTVEQIESAKADIQNRIYSGDSPSSKRVDQSIRPLIEYSPTLPGIKYDASGDDTGGLDDASGDDTGDLDD